MRFFIYYEVHIILVITEGYAWFRDDNATDTSSVPRHAYRRMVSFLAIETEGNPPNCLSGKYNPQYMNSLFYYIISTIVLSYN